jgi:hypothetical protein
MEDLQKETLAATVDTNGAAYLQRLTGITNWVLSGTVLVSLIATSNSVVRFIADTLRPSPGLIIRYSYGLSLAVVLVESVVTTFVAYFYWKFARVAYRSTTESDGERFNQSFRYLCRSSQLAILHLIVHVSYGLYTFWWNFRYLDLVRHRYN